MNVQLIEANLEGANLKNANFRYAKLKGIKLSFSNLENSKLYAAQLQGGSLVGIAFKSTQLGNSKLEGSNLFGSNLQGADLSSSEFGGAKLKNTELQEANLESAQLQGAYLESIKYSKSTIFPIEEQKKWDVPCLTDDKKLPICKKYNPADTETLNKITAYWINDLACSDKWIAQGIMRNYLFDEENSAKFKTYLIPLLKNKLTDKDCTGIQSLPDDFKQQIKDAIKQP